MPYAVLVALIAAERGVELLIARRNSRRVAARGGFVAEPRSYTDAVVIQIAWLLACPLEAALLRRPLLPGLAVPMLVLLAAAQALRYWAIATLGDRWNLRIVVVPGEPAITGGPYRFLRHPNYLAVLLESAALPLVHTAWLTAAVFVAAVSWHVRRRIRLEESALAAHSDYAAAFAGKRRLVP